MAPAVSDVNGSPKSFGRGAPYYLGTSVLWMVGLLIYPFVLRFFHLQALGTFEPHVVAFCCALLGILSAAVGLGVDVVGQRAGILWASGRNTYSLSRLQMVLWSWLILSAIMAAMACRAWGLGGTLATALSIKIDGNLLGVMGISLASGAATPGVLALRSQDQSGVMRAAVSPQPSSERMYLRGSIAYRPKGKAPRLGDFVRGDDAGSMNMLDLGKVQNLLLTLILVVYYTLVLFNFFGHANLFSSCEKGVCSTLPSFPPGMVDLLLISHGGYLAYKAMPKPGDTTRNAATAFAGPPPSPDQPVSPDN